MLNKEIKEKALEFLMAQKGGVISTVSGSQPQSAFIYYDADEDFSIYFPTTITTRKHLNIQTNNKVAFNVSTVKPPQTIQMEGVVEQVTEKVIIENALANYIDIATYQMKDKAPITKLDWEKGVILYRIKPTWLKWSDFSDIKTKSEHSVSIVLIDNKNSI